MAGDGGPAAVAVGTFGGVSALPVLVAADRGLFVEFGVDARLVRVSSSRELRDGLLGGRLDVIHATVDDLIAWRDGSGADIVGWIGGTSGPVALVARGSFATIADLRGQAIGVDDPHSGFATILRYRLRSAGVREEDVELVAIGATRLRVDALREGRIAATLLSLPFSLQARDWGATVLDDGRADPPAAAAVSQRAWLEANASVADDYCRAVLAAVTSLSEPIAPEEPVEAIARILGIEVRHAAEMQAVLFGSPHGWPASAGPDRAGFEAAWRLRTEVGDPPNAPPEEYQTDLVYRRMLDAAAG